MNFDACEIYKRNKPIGILPVKFVKKTEFNEEHLLLSDTYPIKPGYILLINNREKLYVTDIRLHHPDDHKLEIYYETAAEHTNQVKSDIYFWLPFTVSIVAFFRPEIIVFIKWLIKLFSKN